METFHALLGYCHDPHMGYGHYYPYGRKIYLFIY
jgi:hypothetical protein